MTRDLRRLDGDDGMTLIELIICIVILAVVVLPITMVMQFAFATARSGQQRTSDSAGAQLMSSYLVSDVQSAEFVWTSDHNTDFTKAFPDLTDATKPPIPTIQCGNQGGADTKLELQWRDPATGAVNAVTYDVMSAGASSDTAFARHAWTVAGGTCTPADTSVLVDAMDTTKPPVVVCEPVSCVSPSTVHLTVVALSKQATNNSSLYSSYTYDLTATRRTG